MPHLTVLGTQTPATRCDPRRTAARGAGGVTTVPTLLAERYLHTTSVGCRYVSGTPVENPSWPLRASPRRPGLFEMLPEPQGRGRRSDWPAADLRVCDVDIDSGPTRPSDGTSTLPATNRVGRRASSMAGRAPSDIGVAEVHDSFTQAELIGYEDHGFAEPAAVSAVTILEGPVTDGR